MPALSVLITAASQASNSKTLRENMVGESTTPLTNLLLEEFADRYDLPRIRAFPKWGTWQRARPDVACGLKRGFTFLFHRPDEAFADTPDHAHQLLMAASPNDEVADTHWYRPDFDWALVQEAEAAGAIPTRRASKVRSRLPSGARGQQTWVRRDHLGGIRD
jgi:FADH2 O2-dependent halogenase